MVYKKKCAIPVSRTEYTRDIFIKKPDKRKVPDIVLEMRKKAKTKTEISAEADDNSAGKEHAVCELRGCRLNDDVCWGCKHNLRHHVDPTRPSNTMECKLNPIMKEVMKAKERILKNLPRYRAKKDILEDFIIEKVRLENMLKNTEQWIEDIDSLDRQKHDISKIESDILSLQQQIEMLQEKLRTDKKFFIDSIEMDESIAKELLVRKKNRVV